MATGLVLLGAPGLGSSAQEVEGEQESPVLGAWGGRSGPDPVASEAWAQRSFELEAADDIHGHGGSLLQRYREKERRVREISREIEKRRGERAYAAPRGSYHAREA